MSQRWKQLEELYGITWEHLVEMEPRLQSLLHDAEQSGANTDEHNLEIGWGRFKCPLSDLVGFHRPRRKHESNPLLRSVGAYEVAYHRLHYAFYCN